jgi:Arc/MetJ-type ribon-helix-helix transcriptional regulator
MLHQSKISLVITTKQLKALQAMAAERQLSVSDVVREAIRNALEKR